MITISHSRRNTNKNHSKNSLYFRQIILLPALESKTHQNRSANRNIVYLPNPFTKTPQQSAHHLPSDHKEIQPFLPGIQRSADAPSNFRKANLIHPTSSTPHFSQRPHTTTTPSRRDLTASPRRSPEPTSTRLPGVRPINPPHTKKSVPTTHPGRKERSHHFHQI